MKIMLSAGETSGDLRGAELAGAIKKLAPETELIGFGGEEMERAGVRLRQNYADYNVMGISAVLLNLRRIYNLLEDLTAFMATEKPDLLLIIDYPDFNWRLAKRAKAMGIPVFSYSPPSAWAWRKGRAKKCSAIADELVAIFPHELAPYEAAGGNISFLGNPLIDSVKPELEPAKARKYFGISDTDLPILLLPGSRKQEIELLLPAMLAGAKIMLAKHDNIKLFLPVAPSVPLELIRSIINEASLTDKVILTHEYRYSLMSVCEASVATSGTVVMETAISGLPAVVLYRLSPLSYIIGRLFVDVEHFSLPNILLGEMLQQELLQDAITPERIAGELERIIKGGDRRDYVLAGLKRAVARLGEPNSAMRIAERIIARAKSAPTN